MRPELKHSFSNLLRPAIGSVPLSALRFRLDDDSDAVQWGLRIDGVPGRALMTPSGATVAFALRLDGPLRLRSRVRLLPHDWRDGRGGVRASVFITNHLGAKREIWHAVLSSADRGAPGGVEIDCTVPDDTCELVLHLEAGRPQYRAVARAMWIEPRLWNTTAPSSTDASVGAVTPLPRDAPAAETPLISVLTPVHDPPLPMLREAIESVRSQTFSGWELCLSDDGSRDPAVIAELTEAAASDPRIRVVRSERPGGISAATNVALGLARGRYIALLDHDDTLTPDALATVAEWIGADSELDMLYSDEDIVADGRQIWVHLKPAWSLDTLRTNGYTCHLGVYRADLVREIGGFRSQFDGSQDVDMILRLTERTERIAHIPRILYHWRAHEGSTSGADAKPYAYVAARNAITAHLERCGLDAEVGFGPPGLYRVTHRVDPATTLDFVLALDSAAGLETAAASWAAQSHPAWGVCVAAPADILSDVTDALTRGGVEATQIRTIGVAEAGVPGALSASAALSEAEHLLFMRQPAAGITYDWLIRLIGYSAQPGIGAAGPLVVAADGRALEAGLALPKGNALHLLHGTRTSMDLFFGYGTSVYNVSAVSGFMATTRVALERHGLRSEMGDLALADFCLRCGERVVVVPDARLRLTVADRAENDLVAMEQLRRSWMQTRDHDPFYNPGYRTDRGDFELVR